MVAYPAQFDQSRAPSYETRRRINLPKTLTLRALEPAENGTWRLATGIKGLAESRKTSP
jgi:hypothetical protein